MTDTLEKRSPATATNAEIPREVAATPSSTAIAASSPPAQAPSAELKGALTPADYDRLLHAWQSRFTGGRSPSTLGLAFMDWAAHAANAPFETAALGRSAFTQWMRPGQAALGGKAAIVPPEGDRRFSDAAWEKGPYALLAQSALLGEEWWDSLSRQPAGVVPQHRRLVAFSVRQWLDLVSPSNLPWLNPQVLEATRASGGANLEAGVQNLLRDEAAAHGDTESAFRVGVDVAATPGKVVFRNPLWS